MGAHATQHDCARQAASVRHDAVAAARRRLSTSAGRHNEGAAASGTMRQRRQPMTLRLPRHCRALERFAGAPAPIVRRQSTMSPGKARPCRTHQPSLIRHGTVSVSAGSDRPSHTKLRRLEACSEFRRIPTRMRPALAPSLRFVAGFLHQRQRARQHASLSWRAANLGPRAFARGLSLTAEATPEAAGDLRSPLRLTAATHRG